MTRTTLVLVAVLIAIHALCACERAHPKPTPPDDALPAACCAYAPDGSAVVSCTCATLGSAGISDSCAGHPESTTCALGVACGQAFYPGGCP